MAKTRREPRDTKQINPSIATALDQRLDELGDVYNAEKYLIANVALEYGARHFGKAWDEYNAVRKGLYRDGDDASPPTDTSNVVQLPAQNVGD